MSSGTTYHLLTESEPFSEYHGGAISRWAGNVLRRNPRAIVVCPATDSTWMFPPAAVHRLLALASYRNLRGLLARAPWSSHLSFIRGMFRSILCRIGAGDIVWVHNRPEFAIALTPVVRSLGGRVVLHLHNAHLVEGPEKVMAQVEVDQLVFASRFLLEQARGKFPLLGASSVLYSGADETIFYPAVPERRENHPPTVLFAGRLVENKGVHILLDAMRLLEQRKVGLQAQIVGSSSFGAARETEYVKRLKSNRLASVSFLSYRSGAALGDLFREADIFCSPAVWDEPFGLVNVEALASGLPVVSTRGGGANEIFATGGGILVERGSAERLASALQKLAEDAVFRRRLGQQAYHVFIERFTWDHTRAGMEEIQQALRQ